MKKLILSAAVCAASFISAQAFAADQQIQIVGSSTVYPFVTVAAESFGKDTDFATPIVESTGTGGGFKLFCDGVGTDYPDFSNASRAIKDSEVKLCADNGVENITEIKLGYDGIVLANAKGGYVYDLTKAQIFNALAKEIAVDGKLVANPHTTWHDVDASLPDVKIEVYGPPTTSGTRDAFVELVLEKACQDLPTFKAAYEDKKTRKKACHMMREDGHYIEAGENDNLIVQKLQSNPKALGIFGFSFLDQNQDTVNGSLVGGVAPTFENIASGDYGISRSLFVYLKDAHVGVVDGVHEFATLLISDDMAGETGYMTEKGLIPLPEDELATIQARVKALVSQ